MSEEVKKHRGRPKLNKEPAIEKEKKQRGRPKKIITETEADNETEKKKRGRAKKPIILENEDPLDINSIVESEQEDILVLFIPIEDYTGSALFNNESETKPNHTLENIKDFTTSNLESNVDFGLFENKKKTNSDHSVIEKNNNVFSKITVYNLDIPTINYEKYHCWWDGHTFSGPIIQLPYELKRKGQKNDKGQKDLVFFVKGCFCSFNCAKAYNRYQTEVSKRDIRDSLIMYLYREMTNDRVYKIIEEAPPIETLKVRGGYLDISQFRNSVDKKYTVLQRPKISHIKVSIEENQRLS